uniref:Uncharacterized protein n=1 Tax=Knipowitschia caucasica TaxID=637954 RepID=A0AAV2JUS8_KNICA
MSDLSSVLVRQRLRGQSSLCELQTSDVCGRKHGGQLMSEGPQAGRLTDCKSLWEEGAELGGRESALLDIHQPAAESRLPGASLQTPSPAHAVSMGTSAV